LAGGSLGAAVVLATSISSAATGARYCPTPTYPSHGVFAGITVTGVGCTTGRKVAVSYYKCRTRGGNLAGTCPRGVLGFRCHEIRNGVPTFFTARVTCRRRRTTVHQVYQQFLR
jgi:hypothetical protein